MANVVWCDVNSTDKLYLQSGEFSSTVKDSVSVASVDALPNGASFDGTNTPWCGNEADKLYLQSGKFTGTLKTSLAITAAQGPVGISYDGANTPWVDKVGRKLLLQSGQFVSTVKTSQSVTSLLDGNFPAGISFDGDHTLFGRNVAKLFLTSGKFSTVVKDSQSTAVGVAGIGFTGTNTLWSMNSFLGKKLYLQSGEFSSTLKTSLDVSSLSKIPTDLETDDVSARLSGTAFVAPDTTVSVFSITHSRRRRV